MKNKFFTRLFIGAVAHRTPLPVTKVIVFPHGDTYPICPRCSLSLERDYQSFCDRCGQKLSWDLYQYAKICYPGTNKE